MIKSPIDYIGNRLHAPVRVPIKHAARKPVLHQQKKRVSCLGITWGNERANSMCWRHARLYCWAINSRNTALKNSDAHGYASWHVHRQTAMAILEPRNTRGRSPGSVGNCGGRGCVEACDQAQQSILY